MILEEVYDFMKPTLTILIALLLTLHAATHAADLSLLSEGTSDYQIVVPDTLETPALTECLNQTARLVQTAFMANGAEVSVVTETLRDAAKPALLLFPRYGYEPAIREVPPSETFIRLTQASTNYVALGEAGFEALSKFVQDVPARAIDYRSGEEAMELVERLWGELA